MPVIFVSAFLIVLYGLWTVPNYKKMLLVLTFFMAIYVAASTSILAISLLIFGLFCFAIFYWKLNSESLPVIVFVLVSIMCWCYLSYEKDITVTKYNPYYIAQTEPTLSEHIKNINYYIDYIASSKDVFLMGNSERPDKLSSLTSYNYYIQFIYSFGVLALLPMLVALAVTLKQIYCFRRYVFAKPSLFCLSAIVLYLLFIDNSFTVGLIEPYSGIYTFFLWGVLSSKLLALTEKC